VRYQILSKKAIRCIFSVLFCIALLTAELNITGASSDLDSSHTTKAGAITKAPSHKTDSIYEVKEASGDEFAASISAGAVNTLSFKVLHLKYIFLRTVLLYIPLILFARLTVLLQDGYIGRRFLMQFIHNSDGEKGAAGI
jgi:hypothetical protein